MTVTKLTFPPNTAGELVMFETGSDALMDIETDLETEPKVADIVATVELATSVVEI